jgi:hypothetical protein
MSNVNQLLDKALSTSSEEEAKQFIDCSIKRQLLLQR